MSEHGAQFDRAQRAYDNQGPDDDWPEGYEHEECEHEPKGMMHFTSYRRTRRYLQWEAKCDKCKQKQSGDNFDE